MKVCDCGSHAINPGQKGRDDKSNLESCDVCYWRKRAERKEKTIKQQASELEELAERYMKAASECVELEKELEALRGFATRVLSPYIQGELFKPEAKTFGLIDANGNPTTLLTGERE